MQECQVGWRFQMMEFLANNASKVGDGGNFPATWYNQAADHIYIAAYRSPDGTTKTDDQVEAKYKFVFLQFITNYLLTNTSPSSNSSSSSSLTTEIAPQVCIGTMRSAQILQQRGIKKFLNLNCWAHLVGQKWGAGCFLYNMSYFISSSAISCNSAGAKQSPSYTSPSGQSSMSFNLTKMLRPKLSRTWAMPSPLWRTVYSSPLRNPPASSRRNIIPKYLVWAISCPILLRWP